MQNKLRVACVAAILLGLAFILGLYLVTHNGDRVDHEALIREVDAELTGPVIVLHSGPGEDYEWRSVNFQEDGKTPRVYKDLLKPQYYRQDDGKYESGVAVRYQFFRKDGTLERVKIIEPVSVYGASCLHKTREQQFSLDGKVKLSEKFLRENGNLAAEYKCKPDSDNSWFHYRPDKTLAHIQNCSFGRYQYIHYCKNAQIWWTYEHIYADEKSGKRASATGKVFFDWDGNPVSKQFSRHDLIGSYSLGLNDPPLPTHQDTYTRPDGSREYRQTWVAMNRADGCYAALSRLEIFSKDGTKVERVIELNPQAVWKPRIIKSDTNAADGKEWAGTSLPPENFFQGFNVDVYPWEQEHIHDI